MTCRLPPPRRSAADATISCDTVVSAALVAITCVQHGLIAQHTFWCDQVASLEPPIQITISGALPREVRVPLYAAIFVLPDITLLPPGSERQRLPLGVLASALFVLQDMPWAFLTL